MSNRMTLAGLIGLLAIPLVAGCAPAYDDYSGCRVNCRYCAPPPLPYTQFQDCVCHSCAAARYLAVQPIAEEPADVASPADYDANTR